MRLSTFGLLAIAALAIGVGLAEFQLRHTGSPVEPIANSTAPKEGFDKLAADLAAAINRDRDVAIKEMRADCTFRYPGKFPMIESCTTDEAAAFDQMRNIFAADTNHTAGAVLACMSTNRSLNGFDWKMTSICYEKSAVASK